MESYYREHMRRIRQAMQANHLDLLYLNFGADFTYLTGIEEPEHYFHLRLRGDWISGVILGIDQDPVLVLQEDFARPNFLNQTWIKEVREMPPDYDDPEGFLASALAEFNPQNKRIGVSKTCWGQTLLALQAAAPSAAFISTTDEMMDAVRVVKDEQELVWMKQAAEITANVMRDLIPSLRIGMTVKDVKVEMISLMKDYDTAVSFGPTVSSAGRHIPAGQRSTDRTILAPGSTLSFDYGVRVHGYCSDYGRTFFIGKPLPEALKAYAFITSVVQDVTAMLGEGMSTPESVYLHGMQRARREGFLEGYYKWGIGHAIGLVIHEWPWLREGATEPFKAGMCLCVEPKVGSPGLFYTRCEDIILVGKDKGTVLSVFPYEPVVIDS